MIGDHIALQSEARDDDGDIREKLVIARGFRVGSKSVNFFVDVFSKSQSKFVPLWKSLEMVKLPTANIVLDSPSSLDVLTEQSHCQKGTILQCAESMQNSIQHHKIPHIEFSIDSAKMLKTIRI